MRSYWLREMSLPSFPDGPEGLVWSLNREMGGDNFIHITEVQVADIRQPGVLRKGATHTHTHTLPHTQHILQTYHTPHIPLKAHTTETHTYYHTHTTHTTHIHPYPPTPLIPHTKDTHITHTAHISLIPPIPLKPHTRDTHRCTHYHTL